jgi:competence protein ComEC
MVRRRLLPSLLLTLVLLLGACRTAPPPSAGGGSGSGAPGVVAKGEGGTAALADKVILDTACSNFANEADQIVCITNTTGAAVDISQWLVRNALGRTFYFPAGTTIQAGQSLKLHTGSGAADAQNIFWNYDFKPVFDRREQITLISTDNVEISKLTTP